MASFATDLSEQTVTWLENVRPFLDSFSWLYARTTTTTSTRFVVYNEIGLIYNETFQKSRCPTFLKRVSNKTCSEIHARIP